MVVHHPVDAFLHRGETEVQYEPDFESHHAEVREKLPAIKGRSALRAFDLHYNDPINQEIHAERLFDPATAIVNRENMLLLDRMPAPYQFVSQQDLICGFEKPGAEIAVQHDSRFDDA